MRVNHGHRHAVVVGAGAAGLLAARVLADHHDRVTVFERDRLPDVLEHRRGAAQGRHAHPLLARGARIVEELFPGFANDVIAAGGLGVDRPDRSRWYRDGVRMPFGPLGPGSLLAGRPLLESLLRRRLEALGNVRVVTGHTVAGLHASGDGGRVTGVRVVSPAHGAVEEDVDADLVVDASGRSGRGAAWLAGLGLAPPEPETVRVGLRYVTRSFRRHPGDLGGDLAVVVPGTPDIRRGGVMTAQEGDRWLVTLYGYLDDEPAVDLGGFTSFAAVLAVPDIHEAVRSAEPLDEGVSFRFPGATRRRYERVERLPAGYLAVGDALCSLDPARLEGMTVAAVEADLLRECLAEAAGPDGAARADGAAGVDGAARVDGAAGVDGAALGRRFLERAAAVVDPLWEAVRVEEDGSPWSRTGRDPRAVWDLWAVPGLRDVRDVQGAHAARGGRGDRSRWVRERAAVTPWARSAK